jgi:hypothetical protein
MVRFTEGSSKKLYTSPNLPRNDITGGTLSNDERSEKYKESSLGNLKGSDYIGAADVNWRVIFK